MSKNGKLIFKTYDPYVTSKFGYRAAIYKNGKLISKAGGHDGVDYGTNGKKLPQYAIEDGKVLGCGTDSTKAKFVYVYYPRLKHVGLHYHLDSIKVKKGQKVTAETIVGTTGTTGNSTGIHLHFGWFPYKNWGKAWAKRGWKDFEKYVYEPEPVIEEPTPEEPKEEPVKPKEEPKPAVTIKVGDKVKVKSRVDYNGVTNAKWVLKAHFTVRQINKNRVVIGRNGKTTGAWNMKDLKKV